MYRTAEVAELIGVSKKTLLRWIGDGRMPDVGRDWRNWRVWSDADVARARALRDALHGLGEPEPVGEAGREGDSAVEAGAALKAAEMSLYAMGMSRLAAGRAYRDEGEESPKRAALPVYGSAMRRLSEGRAYRVD